MNTDDLITFVKAAELLNFSKAAKELNYSQSSVTVQIKKLEEEFGVQLFNRIGKNVSLTPAGSQLVKHANKILNDIRAAKEDVGNPDIVEKHITIGCIDSLCNCHMPKILQKVHENDLEFSINIVTSSPSELLDLMDKNQIDLVYIFDKPIYNSKWVKAFESKEQMRFITAADSDLVGKKLEVEDIINYPFYLTETNDNYRFALDQKLAELNLEISPFLEVSNTDVIMNTLKLGKGISYLPKFAYESAYEDGKVGVLDVEGFDLEMSRQLFYHKNKYVTWEMEKFIELLKEVE